MRKYLPWAIGLVALLAVAWGVKYHYVQQGVWRERGRVADSLLVLARAESARLDTVYLRDTTYLTKWRTRFDTARLTINVHDTVEVLRFVAVADSTVKACSAALSTCELRIGAEKAISAQWEARWRAERATKPGFLGVWVPRVAAFGVGVAIGKFAP